MPGKATWKEGRFNSYSLYLTGELCVNVSWDSLVPKGEPTGYKVSFAGVTVEEKPQDIQQAQKLGEELAWRVLSKAIDRLPSLGGK
jgi:hypothetical protein